MLFIRCQCILTVDGILEQIVQLDAPVESIANGMEKWCSILSTQHRDCLASVEDTTSGYIDDLLIGTVRLEHDTEAMLRQHDIDIRRTLDALNTAQLVASAPKCQFFVKEVEWYGNVLRDGVRKPMPGKLSAITKWELPMTVTALRSFLGFCNYYSIYIQGFAMMAASLLDSSR